MADYYYDKCGSCTHLNWNDCYYGKFACTARKGCSYTAIEPVKGCKYYENNHLSNEEIEKMRMKYLK